MASWLSISPDSQFSLANIPFGIVSPKPSGSSFPAIAIGDLALNLSAFADGEGFSQLPVVHPHLDVFHQKTLNAFAALGRPVHRQVREYLQTILKNDTPFPKVLKENVALKKQVFVPLSEINCHLPLQIGDYTDFYAGIHHAYNVGVLFRGPDNALQPNYKHLPVGYHGRASSVVPSGTPITRPKGQILGDPTANPKVPVFSPSKKLDIELEMAAFISTPNKLGTPISIDEAEDHIFGLVLMNDWSARDIQAWEYVPLGPFNSKNFGTTISPWVVLIDALEPFRTNDGPETEDLLPYLQEKRDKKKFNIRLEVDLKAAGSNETEHISTSNSSNLLFSFPQMVAHHTITGCNLRTGDLLGSGTISGKDPGSEGSLLEQSKGGKQPITLKNGKTRSFLEDGDQVSIRGIAGEAGSYVGFGDCVGTIVPALT